MKSFQITLLLALLFCATSVSAESRPQRSSSFKSGFSSQKSAPTSSNKSGGFGSFGQRPSAPPPPPAAPAPARNGSFGSFGGGAQQAPKKSDSALSRNLDKSNAEANALRTLDARRAAEQAAKAPAPMPVPVPAQTGQQYGGYNQPSAPRPVPAQTGQQYGGGYGQAPPPVVVQQNSGVGNVVTGFLLGRATAPSYNNNNNRSYPGTAVQQQQQSSSGWSFWRIFAWLLIVAVIGWLVYFAYKFLTRSKAPSTANYTFERN